MNSVPNQIVILCSTFSGHLLSNFEPHSLPKVVRFKLLFLGCTSITAISNIPNTISMIFKISNVEFIFFIILSINLFFKKSVINCIKNSENCNCNYKIS